LPENVIRLSSASAINDNLQIAGSMVLRDDMNRMHAYRCSVVLDDHGYPLAEVDFRDLSTPPGCTWSYGYSVNNDGDVAGRVEDDDSTHYCGALWSESHGWLEIANMEQANDVNDTRQVVVWMVVDGQKHVARCTPGLGAEDLGALVEGSCPLPCGINSRGQVAANTHRSVVLYTDRQGMKDLGSLYSGKNGLSSLDDVVRIRMINSHGHVVGMSRQIRTGAYRPFRYTAASSMLDLRTLISNLPGEVDIKTLEVRAINDYPGHHFGKITANAIVNGVSRAFVLTPDR
jgi:probable HAF family extracellular repeat protein